MEVFKLVILVFIISISCATAHWDIKDVARNISREIEGLKNNELGVPFILNLYTNFMFIQPTLEIVKVVNNVAHKLDTKLSDIFSVLESTQMIIDSKLSQENITSFNSSVTPCFLKGTSKYPNISYPDSNLDLMENINILDKKNLNSISDGIRRLYFISNFEVKKLHRTPFLHCTECNEKIIWNNYLVRNIYQRKNVILILDIGGSMNHVQFSLLKQVAKKMLSVLHKNDRVSVLTVSSNYTYLENDCNRLYDLNLNDNIPRLKPATTTYVKTLDKYIDAIISEIGLTNHTLGFEKAFGIVSNNLALLKNETVMILYASRGLLSSLMEPKQVLEMIERFTRTHNISLFINTCAIIDELKPVVYEPQFMCDIAYQNYSKYNIPHQLNLNRKLGLMLKVDRAETIPFVVERFYSVFNPKSNFDTGTKIYLPTWDKNGEDLIVSFTKGWKKRNNFVMIGIDVYFSNLAEDIIYYSGGQDYSYIFLIDIDSNIVYHPYYSRVADTSQSVFVDLENIENVPDVKILKMRLLTEKKGIFQVFKNNHTDLVQYAWTRISDWYIVCLVVNTKYGAPSKPQKSVWFQNDFLYQNIEDYKLCRHLNLLATIDVTSLYLSPSCFRSPFLASHTAQNKMHTQDFVAYLKDDSRLLINPGLKEEVRDEVSLLSHVLTFLQKRHLSSEICNYVVRRYASSTSGVFQMFPGSTLKPGWNPIKSLWYYKARQHKGKMVLLPPYLDKGGAGYIITLAYSTSQLVIGVDLTYGFMLKMLVNLSPNCLEKNITCFLIDDEGYIVYHPNLMTGNGAKPIEQQHIVHKESLVSNDILNHKHFIQKLLCNSYGDDTIQRYYKLNTSFDGVLVNFAPGEQCVKYQITSIPNTNIFFGIVNVSCNFGATFCPCSIIDRLCLNCNRMEQKECECPCECPLDNNSDICDMNPVFTNVTENLPCTRYTEESLGNSFIVNSNNNLEPCFPVRCHEQTKYLDCLGLLGCEWCMFDMERNELKKPFCASITTCFKGMFDITDTSLGKMPSVEFSPVGPIIYSIIAITILFVLLLVCYRSYTNQIAERLYMSSTQLRMSDLNITENFHDLGNHRDKLIQEEHRNVISPYCVASTYRRTAVPADSDHGYSTMTPHDESEHMSLAPVEVDSLEDDILSDSTSIHTSMSTKETPRLLSPMFTKISHRNYITVPVTVHQNMEKT